MGLTPVKKVLALATCFNRKEKTVNRGEGPFLPVKTGCQGKNPFHWYQCHYFSLALI